MTRIFISYARSDGRELALKLAESLRAASHEVWLDTAEIQGGAVWQFEIERAIDQCEVALALLSAGSYKSEICRAEQEMSLNKGKRVIPLLVQANAERPLTLFVRQYLDFSDPAQYAERLATLLDVVNQTGDFAASTVVVKRKRWPALPNDFIPRPEVTAELRQLVLNADARRHIALTALRGMGGIGKTMMAKALCEDPEVQAAFPDGIYWVEIGRDGLNLQKKLQTLARELGDDPAYYETSTHRLRSFLADKAVLLVLDDVWNSRDVEPFLVDAPRCRVLLTTRKSAIADSLGASEYRLELLDEREAVEWLRTWSGRDESTYAELAHKVGYLPMALKLVGARLKRGMTGEQWLKQYSEHASSISLGPGPNLPDRTQNLTVCFDLSADMLGENKFLYHSLGIFPEDEWIPTDVAKRLWKSLPPDKAPHKEDHFLNQLVETLEDLALITLNRNAATFSMHDLLHDYNRLKLDKLGVMTHEALLSAFNPDGQKSWPDALREASGPDGAYLRYHFTYHMLGAARQDHLFRLLEDAPAWIASGERNTTVEYVVLSMFRPYHKADPERARRFLKNWLAQRAPAQQARASSAARPAYNPKALAVQCALQTALDDVLELGLRHPEEGVRLAAMACAFYRYRQDSEAGFNIYRAGAERIRPNGITSLSRGRTVLESILNATIHEYQIAYQKSEAHLQERSKRNINTLGDIAARIIRKALYMDVPGLRLLTPFLTKVTIRFGVRFVESRLSQQGDKSDEDAPVQTWMNLPEGKLFFERIKNRALPARRMLSYWDRHRTDLVGDWKAGRLTLDDLVRCFDGTIASVGLEYAFVAHGTANPDSVLPILRALFDHPSTEWCDIRHINVLGAWRHILLFQNVIEPAWFSAAQELFGKYYDQRTRDYGIITSTLSRYEYFPLAGYSRIWNKWRPTQRVDLVDKYLKRAEETDDRDLIVHILKGFGDPRLTFTDYSGILEHFVPYFDTADPKIRAVVIRTLSLFRARDPDTVEEFIGNARVRDQDIVAQIRERSYQQPPYYNTLGFADLLYALVALAPLDSMTWLFDNFDMILDKGNLPDAVGGILGSLMEKIR